MTYDLKFKSCGWDEDVYENLPEGCYTVTEIMKHIMNKKGAQALA